MEPITLLILDVDGVLTDGRLPYDEDGNVVKHFHVQDGGAIRLWQKFGGQVAIISGRTSPAVERRAADVGVTALAQGVRDKLPAYEQFMTETGATDAQVCFVGDDLIDLPPMRRCGWPVAVANARPQVKRAAAYVTRRRGGHGAVAEVVERLLRRAGRWGEVLSLFDAGREAAARAARPSDRHREELPA